MHQTNKPVCEQNANLYTAAFRILENLDAAEGRLRAILEKLEGVNSAVEVTKQSEMGIRECLSSCVAKTGNIEAILDDICRSIGVES